jgi:hypothetical protein
MLQVLSSREITTDNEDWVVIMGIVIEDIEAFRHGGDIWEFLHFDLIDDNTNVQSFIMTFALHNM